MTKKVAVEKIDSIEDSNPTKINLRKLIWWKNTIPPKKENIPVWTPS